LIFRRLALALAAAACLAAAAGTAIVALAFALYALLRDPLGPAGAAACVVAAAVIVAALAGLILMQVAHVGRRGPRRREMGVGGGGALAFDSLADLVRDRPFAAAVLAAAVGWVITRSPGLAGALGDIISRRDRDRRN
jgi:hypothetical protein